MNRVRNATSLVLKAVSLGEHRIDRNEWPNQLDYGWDIFGPKATAASSHPRGVESVDAAELTVFPNPGVGIVGTDPTRISPGVD